MGILKEYKDFDEKKTFANIIKIDTKGQFDELFDKLKPGTGSYWRGVNESKHMTYSSAQRMWIRENLSHENSVFEEYIKHIYNYVSIWHGSCFSKVLNKGLSIPSGLSILQHYGCPTPLIDVTKDPLVGLFFASYYTNSFFSKNSLDNYFSLYEITKFHPVIKAEIKNLSSNWFQSNNNKIKLNPNKINEFTSAVLNDTSLFLDTYKNPPYTLLKDDDEDNIRFNINNTPNIVNQQGAFILLMSPIKPFEEILIEIIVQSCSTKEKGYLQIEEAKEKHKSNFISYDIHKKLKVYCIDKLSKKGVTEEFIFPKLEQLANEPLKSFLLSDSNK